MYPFQGGFCMYGDPNTVPISVQLQLDTVFLLDSATVEFRRRTGTPISRSRLIELALTHGLFRGSGDAEKVQKAVSWIQSLLAEVS
jgi:hypothetical protein